MRMLARQVGALFDMHAPSIASVGFALNVQKLKARRMGTSSADCACCVAMLLKEQRAVFSTRLAGISDKLLGDSMDNIFTKRSECPACGREESTEIFSAALLDPNIRHYVSRKIGDSAVLEQFQDIQYALLKCPCGLIYQQNILSDSYLYRMYDEWVVHKEVVPDSIASFPYIANEMYVVASLFSKPVYEIKVLDYGLGNGKWARIAAAIGFDVYGTDLSEQLLDDAKRRGIKTLAIDEIEQHQFDFINTEQVFEHLARPRETLAKLMKCLAPCGIVKISVPDGKGIESRLPRMDWSAPRGSKHYLIPVTPLVHINTFTDRAIEYMGQQYGLIPVRPSLRNEYKMLDGTSWRGVIKSLLRPIYRRWHGSTYIFLRMP